MKWLNDELPKIRQAKIGAVYIFKTKVTIHYGFSSFECTNKKPIQDMAVDL